MDNKYTKSAEGGTYLCFEIMNNACAIALAFVQPLRRSKVNEGTGIEQVPIIYYFYGK